MEKNNIKIITKNWKELFCISIIFLSFLLTIAIIIKKPMKVKTDYIYETNKDTVLKKVEFPLEQDINVNVDNLNAITLYNSDMTLNKYNYQIILTDTEGNRYFYHDFKDYSLDYMYMYFGNIHNSKDKTLSLKIICEECKDVYMEFLENKDYLNISMDYSTMDYSYFWYPILGIIIAITLFPLAREEKYEKKSK